MINKTLLAWLLRKAMSQTCGRMFIIVFRYKRCSMLNKQGLFHRTNPASNSQLHDNSPTANAQVKPAPYPMPGHMAAIESANKAAQAIADNKPAITSKSDPVTGSRLIVGPDVKLKGAEILDCDTLVVEGRVEATMDSRIIQVAERGVFSGKVGIDVAEIYGQFDGELTARQQLIVHATGRVSGKIRYGKILVEEGGEVSGDVGMISADSARKDIAVSSMVREKAV